MTAHEIICGTLIGIALGTILGLFLINKQRVIRRITGLCKQRVQVPMTGYYIRKIKATDCRMDFDPFDNPFGGGTPIFYPKFGHKRILYLSMTQTKIVCRYGIFKHNDNIKDLCYYYGPSKQELELLLKEKFEVEKQ